MCVCFATVRTKIKVKSRNYKRRVELSNIMGRNMSHTVSDSPESNFFLTLSFPISTPPLHISQLVSIHPVHRHRHHCLQAPLFNTGLFHSMVRQTARTLQVLYMGWVRGATFFFLVVFTLSIHKNFQCPGRVKCDETASLLRWALRAQRSSYK